MNKNLRLKTIVKHWAFELAVALIIILSFINAIFFMYRYTPLLETFDNIFIWIFFVELIIRIVAYGPEMFFMDRWNNVDTFLVAVGLIFFFVPNNSNADGVVRMSRIFRLASLLRLISHSSFMRDVNFEVGHKIKNIFAILLEIMPIILKFMHLFAFFFYIYVIFGMEIFYNFYQVDTKGSVNYNMYQQVGNFSSLVKGVYVMVQILT
jgi:voltage-gated sodium channel